MVTSKQVSALFEPFQLGSSKLSHRIALSPCTRMRGEAVEDFFVPGELMVEYYSQRATKGGLLITEACPISKTAAGYPGVAGIFNTKQIQGWKKVTDAVHEKGGVIYCQLWHVGRATLAQLIGGMQAISSTTTSLKGGSLAAGVNFEDSPPRVMLEQDFKDVASDFTQAAKNAIELAGFDGVEIHGANGYLLDQFLHDNVNQRTDEYGGTIENRCKFPLQVIESVVEAVGADKVGIRLSPYNYYQGTKDSNPNEHWSHLCHAITSQKSPISYVHMIEARFDEVLTEEDKLKSLEEQCLKKDTFSLNRFRDILKQKGIHFIAAGGFDKDLAAKKVLSDESDIVAFGRNFIANPDLVERFKEDLELNKYDRSTFYGADPPSKGYVDYKFYSA